MHENFEQEMERQVRRLDERIFEPPVVKSLSDIKRLLAELDPRLALARTTTLSSDLTAEGEAGQQIVYKVSAQAEVQNKRAIIIRGLEFIKARLDVASRAEANIEPVIINGKEMLPPIRRTDNARAWVDPLLERWFSASREGLLICWVVEEGKFYYDAFEHKLYRAKPSESSSS